MQQNNAWQPLSKSEYKTIKGNNPNHVIRCSWIKTYLDSCPILVKYNMLGIDISNAYFKMGSEKHAAMDQAVNEKISFVPKTKEDTVKELNAGSAIVQPNSFMVYGKFGEFALIGKPDSLYSVDGTTKLMEYKTTHQENLKIEQGMEFQAMAYLQLLQLEGVERAEGRVLLTNWKKEFLYEKMRSLLKEHGDAIQALEQFHDSKEVFPKQSSVELNPTQLNAVVSQIAHSIEKDSWDCMCGRHVQRTLV